MKVPDFPIFYPSALLIGKYLAGKANISPMMPTAHSFAITVNCCKWMRIKSLNNFSRLNHY
ncbi:MAG: hypothetical protein D6732_08910 [Methanobacteriota archaeon]|nr:MAG: hypothetical protein D6732_08910 [Euryarchaeota archaeon]